MGLGGGLGLGVVVCSIRPRMVL